MKMQATQVKRVFQFKKGKEDLVLDDPNPALTPEEVLSMYSTPYPELTTATVTGPDLKDEQAIYVFKTTVGTKG